MRLPVSVTAPTSRLAWVAIATSVVGRVPVATALRNSAAPTRSDAPPPRPLSNATICGIAVIFTVLASQSPRAVPTTSPAAMIP